MRKLSSSTLWKERNARYLVAQCVKSHLRFKYEQSYSKQQPDRLHTEPSLYEVTVSATATASIGSVRVRRNWVATEVRNWTLQKSQRPVATFEPLRLLESQRHSQLATPLSGSAPMHRRRLHSALRVRTDADLASTQRVGMRLHAELMTGQGYRLRMRPGCRCGAGSDRALHRPA